MIKKPREFHTREFLTPAERQSAAALPYEKRNAMITNLLVRHAAFEEAYAKMEERFMPHPPGWISGLVGDPRVGKSFVAEYFMSKHPPVLTEHGWEYPALCLEVRDDWTANEFSSQIFRATDAAVPRLTVATVNTKSAQHVVECATKLLLLEESHFLWQVRKDRMKGLRGLLQHISNTGCNIHLVGLPSVEVAIENDDQLEARGSKPFHTMTRFKSKAKYRAYLMGIDNRLPFLLPSRLAELYWEDLWEFSDAYGGLTSNLVLDAAFKALREGAPCIELKHLRAAILDRTKPGEQTHLFLDVSKPKGAAA